MDYFTALQIFHSVAQTHSFSATAKQLDLAVSSVTRQIDRLEQELGVDLFYRSTRHIALTARGEQYWHDTRQVLDDLAYANQAIRQQTSQMQGVLNITYPPTFGNAKLHTVLLAFTERYPNIELRLNACDDFVDLSHERMDLAIRLGKVEDENLVAKQLAPQERILCASPAYLAKHGTPTTPDELAKHNCLWFAYRGYAQKWYFRKNHQQYSVQVKGSLVANSAEMLKQACLNGVGIVHLPDWLIQNELDNGQLCRVLDDWHITPSLMTECDAIYLVYPKHSRQLVKIGVLVDFLLERLGQNY